MKISISPKRLREIVEEEIKKKLGEEQKYNPEFAKYIWESLTKKAKKEKQND
tara:strand:+ start:99 stop:254 length:156 start_codon:yes stop_codon:yes gene_type:complete